MFVWRGGKFLGRADGLELIGGFFEYNDFDRYKNEMEERSVDGVSSVWVS